MPLIFLFPSLFLCFGSAVLRCVFNGIEEKKSRIDFTGLIPPWFQWPCVALIAYGFLYGFSSGKITHEFCEAISPEKAALFYSYMISFFSMALLIHVGFSAMNKKSNQKPKPTHF